MHRIRPALRAAALASLVLANVAAHAQGASAPPATTDDALHAMSDAAGIIFTGTVTAIRHPRRPDGTPGGIVQIDFAVADAIRGISSSAYTLREWVGLWAANDQPLRIGQQYLMLLHAPNAGGITSPVAGSDGAIPIRGTGPVATPDDPAAPPASVSGAVATASAAETRPTQVVDLGWVATHVLVPIAYAAPHGVFATPISVHANAHAASLPDTPDTRITGLPLAIPAETRSAPYSTIMGKLRTWETSRAR